MAMGPSRARCSGVPKTDGIFASVIRAAFSASGRYQKSRLGQIELWSQAEFYQLSLPDLASYPSIRIEPLRRIRLLISS